MESWDIFVRRPTKMMLYVAATFLIIISLLVVARSQIWQLTSSVTGTSSQFDCGGCSARHQKLKERRAKNTPMLNSEGKLQ
jgi:sulfite exporter TauE/SafE